MRANKPQKILGAIFVVFVVVVILYTALKSHGIL